MPDDNVIRPTPPMTVEPPKQEAPPPEPEKDDPPPAPESAEPADTPAAEPVEGADEKPEETQDPPKSAEDPPPKTERQKLIDDLTGVGVKPPDAEPEAEPPAPQDKAPEQPEGKQPEKEPEQDPDLVELTNDTAKAMRPGEARRKINRLIDRIKQAEPLAAMSKEIIETCEANKFAPEDYRAWVNIGIGLQQGNPQALAVFKQIAERAGIVTAGGPSVPEGFEAKLAEWEENIDVTPKVAKALREMFKPAAKPPAASAPAPAAASTPAPQPAAPPRSPAAPAAPRPDARQIGYNRMLEVGARYKAKLGDAKWAEIQPLLKDALKAKGDKSPDAWADIYEAEIEKIVAKAPKPKPIQTGVRPSNQGGPAKPAFKSERERVIHEHTA